MVKEISTLIVGGSYFGIGYASAHPDCMILEESHILGNDFHKSLRTADMQCVDEKEYNTELGKLMIEHRVWEGEQFDVLKAAPVIHEYCNQKDLHIVMDAKLLSIGKTESGYCVNYITNSGIHEICCKDILDATVLRDTYPEGIECSAKTLNLFTVCLGDTFEERLQAVAPDCSIEEGMNPNEKVVKFPFSNEVKLPEAYESVTGLWNKVFPEGEEKILFIAQDFEYVCDSKNDGLAPCVWVGAAFENPLTAFAEGMEYQL